MYKALDGPHQDANSDFIRQYVLSELSIFYFIVLDICLAITTAKAKNIDIALAITLVRTS